MLFESIRKLTIPFDKIAGYIPKKGKVLDIGCGHGAFSRMIAQNNPDIKVLGIDPSDYKITLAKSESHNLPNLSYKNQYLNQVRGTFDCIVSMDVFYLLSPEEKSAALKTSYELLNRGGSFILCEIDINQKVLYNLLYLEEVLMVNLLKYTYSDKRRLFFQDRESYLREFKKAGFKKISTEKISGILPNRHILYIAKK